jgi:hypothetical protein
MRIKYDEVSYGGKLHKVDRSIEDFTLDQLLYTAANWHRESERVPLET